MSTSSDSHLIVRSFDMLQKTPFAWWYFQEVNVLLRVQFFSTFSFNIWWRRCSTEEHLLEFLYIRHVKVSRSPASSSGTSQEAPRLPRTSVYLGLCSKHLRGLTFPMPLNALASASVKAWRARKAMQSSWEYLSASELMLKTSLVANASVQDNDKGWQGMHSRKSERSSV